MAPPLRRSATCSLTLAAVLGGLSAAGAWSFLPNARPGNNAGFVKPAAPQSRTFMDRFTPRPVSEVSGPLSSTALSASTLTPPVSTKNAVEEYVKSRGGSRVIKKVLIANNGMAATKSILSMRQWAYMELGDDRAIEFIAMATPEDLNANAEFIRLADRFVEVPGGSNKNNYANVDLIVDVAIREGVDAVWPGWGHASENPKLPNTLKAKGIKFIGPTGPVMSVLGDKIGANILAQTAKVPSIPWSGDGLTAELTEEGTIPQDVFDKAMVTTVEESLAAAERIGYPVMLKASEGGGGKGIRLSQNAEELKTNFVQVQNEVPGSPMFMMQLCTQARHLEVQIVGDEHGNAIALNGRDCSTQRRFQKIFEEGPPTIAPVEIFKQMELAAQRLTQTIGYIGAGTVEYLYNAADNKFYFLELNPRLQVEHPVTEGLTGVNLPATQLQIAMGIPLYAIPDIRRFYGRTDAYGKDKIDFFEEDYPYPKSHVIAARITAENPDEGFKPTSGRIERVKFQSTSNVWGYFSVGANGGIHEFADSQFGHLFAKGATREDARKALVLALKEIEVRGDIRTTVEYLVQLLETPAFKQNTIDTSWLDGLIREKSVKVDLEPHVVAVSAAISRAYAFSAAEEQKFLDNLAKGQTSVQSIRSINSFPVDITFKESKYSFQVTKIAPDKMRLAMGDQVIETKVRRQPDGSLIADFGGAVHTIYSVEEPLGLRMVLDGTTVLLPTVYDPSELRTDVTGKIVRYLQDDGAEVQAGQPYVEVEAMKMIMPLKATESGALTRRMSPGSIITAGDLLATLALKDPSKVKKIVPFTGKLNIGDNVEETTTTEQVLKTLKLALEGYEYQVEPLVQRLLTKLSTPEEASAAVVELLTQYLAVEDNYSGKPLDEAMVGLVKTNKDKLSTVMSLAMAHRELPRRNKLISAAIRQLQALQERTGAVTSSAVADNLMSLLDRTSRLPGKEYGEVAISAAQALLTLRTPPFNARLAELRNTLIKSKDSLDALARSTTLTAGVDLLTALFTDKDVRNSAIEVYIRRVYRSHTILSINVQEVDGVITADWTFRFSDTPPAESPTRRGFFTVYPTVDAYKKGGKSMLAHFTKMTAGDTRYSEPTNVFHVAIAEMPSGATEAQIITDMEGIMAEIKPTLTEAQIRMVNILFVQGSRNPRYFTFPAAYGYKEDPLRRDMRPTFPQLLELSRLAANYELQRLPSMGRNTQVYLGTEKSKGNNKKGSSQVLFVRGISNSAIKAESLGAERLLVMAMDELEYALLDSRVGGSASSRLFLHMLTEFKSDPLKLSQEWSQTMDRLLANYATRLLKLGVDEIEVKVRVQTTNEDGSPMVQPVRLMASSMTGEFLRTDAYVEYPDPITGMTKQFCSISRDEQICLMNPYPASNSIQTRRASARRIGSTYAYDFLGLIEVSLIQKWDRWLKDLAAAFPARMGDKMPEKLFSAEELVLENGVLTKARRLVGLNDIGMIAWHAVAKTPEYPDGRELVIIANDVTFQSGSFGVKEDDFFRAASEYARVRGLPRIYLSSNSGARIGLVDDLKSKFKVAWQDVSNPGLGFKYLYLSKDDFNALKPGTVNAQLIKEEGEERYAISDIIGQVHGIGVENLRGSGMIAGETSRAYDETFTLSYVTGRSVGIGAYLVRLGQRTIQMVNGPLILTGYSALNKLLGREVYTSQDQLGGPQIMAPNGISHLVVENDKEGISAILDWLSFVPKDKYSAPPVIDVAVDSPERDVDFQPTKTPYDPRHMLAGTNAPDGRWVSGFFDRGSFIETLAGWGKSVITGRAKLGGIPFGVIAVETRLVEQRIPADPANPESRESILPQAGQVWYPDSAFKTAQAIEDFNRGENLPLIIFANWRGFSGGTRDMFGEILKFGAKIVDALRTYKHPVFVYIPPNGELRGGAWVVIDPTINEEMMEMYADKDSRGGILEPPGICEVKFRSGDQIAAMHRLDPQIMALDSELENTNEDDAARLKKQIKEREDALLPLYLQVAHEFADLHDRAGRMKAKGVIRDVVTWKRSRSYFFWRAKRRIAEDSLVRAFQAAVPGMSVKDARTKIAGMAGSVYEEDAGFLQWVQTSGDMIDKEVSTVRGAAVRASVASLLQGLSDVEKKAILSGL